MGTKDIEQLLRKYYDGATSDEEEKQLESFFLGSNVPAKLHDDQAYFRSINAMKATAGTPSGLEQRLAAMLDTAPPHPTQVDTDEGRGTTTATVDTPKAPARMASMVRRVMGMAASIAAVVLLGLYLHTRHASDTMAEQATYAQAQAAIMKFSTTLNKGFVQMEKAHEMTKDVGQQINRCIELNCNH